MKILDITFCILPITLGRTGLTINKSQIGASKITFFRNIPGGFGENLKKKLQKNDFQVFPGLMNYHMIVHESTTMLFMQAHSTFFTHQSRIYLAQIFFVLNS